VIIIFTKGDKNMNREDVEPRTRITVRLSEDNKHLLECHKAITGAKTWEEALISLLTNTSGKTKKVLVDADGHCIKAINHLLKFSTNLNQLAKIANENKQLSNRQFEAMQGYKNELIKTKNYLSKKVKIL
jgi:hypothetical protein